MTTNVLDFTKFKEDKAPHGLSSMEVFILQQHTLYVSGITYPEAMKEYIAALKEEIGEENFTSLDYETVLAFFSEINRALLPLIVTQRGNNLIESKSKVKLEFEYLIDDEALSLSITAHFFNKEDVKVFGAQFIVEQYSALSQLTVEDLPLLTFPKENIKMLSKGTEVPAVAPLNMFLNELALDTYAASNGGDVEVTTEQKLLGEERLLSMGKSISVNLGVIRDFWFNPDYYVYGHELDGD